MLACGSLSIVRRPSSIDGSSIYAANETVCRVGPSVYWFVVDVPILNGMFNPQSDALITLDGFAFVVEDEVARFVTLIRSLDDFLLLDNFVRNALRFPNEFSAEKAGSVNDTTESLTWS